MLPMFDAETSPNVRPFAKWGRSYPKIIQKLGNVCIETHGFGVPPF